MVVVVGMVVVTFAVTVWERVCATVAVVEEEAVPVAGMQTVETTNCVVVVVGSVATNAWSSSSPAVVVVRFAPTSPGLMTPERPETLTNETALRTPSTFSMSTLASSSWSTPSSTSGSSQERSMV